MASLLLVRHGQIKANRQGRWHGSTDSPLTWRGRRKHGAPHVSWARSKPPVSAVYSSPLARARHTAEVVARRLGLEVTVHDDLREYAIGEWEGTTFASSRAVTASSSRPAATITSLRRAAKLCGRWRTAWSAALARIDESHPGDSRVLVVGHGAAMAVALGELLDNDPGRWINYHFANCSLTELVLSPVAYVNLFNSTVHL